MAFSAPLNGSGLGELFTHNPAGTSDVYTLASGAPSVGQSLKLVSAAGATQGISLVSQPGVRWRQDASASAGLRCDSWTGYCDGLGATPTADITVTTLVAAVGQKVLVTVHTGSGKWPGVHAFNSTTANPSTTMDSGSITPTAGSDYLVVAFGRFLSGTAAGAPTVGFTPLTTANGYAFAYKILTAHDGSAVQCQWTIASAQYEAQIVAIRVSSSSTVTDANDALMAAFAQTDYTKAGRFKSVRDMRMQALTASEPGVQMVTSHADRVNDYRGAGWGAGDMQAGAATNANGATQVGTAGVNAYLHYAVSQWNQTIATSTDNDLSTVTGQTVVTIGRATVNGGLGGIFRDPTAATAPYIANTAASAKYGVASSGLATIDTAVATGSTIRLLLCQRYDLVSGIVGMTDISSGDQQLCAKVGGRMGNVIPWAVGGGVANSGIEYATGANYEAIGRQNAAFVTGDVYWQAIISGMITQAQMAALEAFAEAQFGAVMDNGFRCIMGAGASFEGGYDDAAAQLANPPMNYAMTVSTGPRGTLIAQGFDAQPFAIQRGIPGRTLNQFNTQFATEYAPHIDSRRPGISLIWLGDLLYNSGKSQSLLQMQAQLATTDALFAAAGGYYAIYTVMSGAYQYAANAFNPATGPSTAGSVVLTLIDWLNTSARSTLTRCRGVQNYEIDPHLKVDTNTTGSCAGVQACADTVYYGAIGGHFNLNGYQYIGTTRAGFLGANDSILYPASTGRGLHLGIGIGL